MDNVPTPKFYFPSNKRKQKIFCHSYDEVKLSLNLKYTPVWKRNAETNELPCLINGVLISVVNLRQFMQMN